MKAHVGIDTQCHSDVAVSGQRLGHLGRQARPLQIGDEQVPQAVQVGEQAVVVRVAEEIRLQPPLRLGRVVLCLVEPLVVGGALDLDRPAIAREGLVEVRGVSATRTAAKNLRGINVPVPLGRKSIDVAFTEHEPDTRYALCVQPNWLTAAAVVEKRADGFRVLFAEAAPEEATIDWQLIR